MQNQEFTSDRTVAAFIHLSTFSQFCFPLGNFIFPLLLWTAKKKDAFVDAHGRQALNFQISIYLYTVFLLTIGVAGALLIGIHMGLNEPFYLRGDWFGSVHPSEATSLILFVMTILLLLLSVVVLNIYAVISATVKAADGLLYTYPLTIQFIPPDSSGINQSENEQSNNPQNQRL